MLLINELILEILFVYEKFDIKQNVRIIKTQSKIAILKENLNILIFLGFLKQF